VRKALFDWQTFSSAFPGRIAIPHTQPGNIPGIPIEVDPPKHTQYRNLVLRYFLRSEVNKLEPALTQVASDLINRFAQRGSCDVVSEYATPLLAHSLGLFLEFPLEDIVRIEAWANAVFANRAKDPEGAKRGQQELAEYIRQQMNERRRSPRDDLFSHLANATVDGKPLSEVELVGFGRILLLAGREAVIDVLGNSLWYLAQNPKALKQLIERPETIDEAVEEFLRYLSPIQLLGRVATRDVEMHGQTIRKGESVAMIYGSANRDAQVFPDADQCILDRRPNAHLAFGIGPHACIGSSLARLDMRVGIREFLKHIPEFWLSNTQGVRRKLNGDARGFMELVLEF
jgi:cytochrome P450